MSKVKELLDPSFVVAVIVYVIGASSPSSSSVICNGVPDIFPLLVLKVNSSGKSGLILKLGAIILPPSSTHSIIGVPSAVPRFPSCVIANPVEYSCLSSIFLKWTPQHFHFYNFLD
jgi:hypothetical protein